MSETKPTNPKDALGIKKAPMSTVSAPFMLGVGAAMMEGALKYGRHNYRAVGVRSSVYYDAAMRHLMAWFEGQDIDPESGLSHLLKAGACLAVLFDSLQIGNLNDDRPPRHKDGWVEDFNKVAEQLIAKYPVPKLAYTQRDQSWAEAAVAPPSPMDQLKEMAAKLKPSPEPVPERYAYEASVPTPELQTASASDQLDAMAAAIEEMRGKPAFTGTPADRRRLGL